MFSAQSEGGRIRRLVLPLLREALKVADVPDVGMELQRRIFPVLEQLLIPGTNTAALEHLHDRGYTSTEDTVRMVREVLPESRGEWCMGSHR